MATRTGRRNEYMEKITTLRGLDLVTPVDMLEPGFSPFAKNFRLYAQQRDDRRVAVSSCKGPGFYVDPVDETLSDSNTATTGASEAEVGVLLGIHAIPFTAGSNDRVTRIDINVRDQNSASGPLLVQLYADDSGVPGELLTESSLSSGSIGSSAAYVTARFLNAYKLTSGNDYWIVLRIQDDGENTYSLQTTTAGTAAWKADTALSEIEEQEYAVNYRLYTASDSSQKGSYRFVRENGNNITLAAFGTTMYTVDETANEFTPLITGLDSNATTYSFARGDGKVFWVNGYDELTAWNGTYEDAATNMIDNADFETDTTDWEADTGSAISRSTSDYHGGVASLQMTRASDTRGASTNIELLANHRYKISFWAKGVSATGNIQMSVNGGGTPVSDSVESITASWAQYEFYYTPGDDVTDIQIQATGTNFFLDDVSVIDTGIEYIIDTQLPILSQVIMHKDRLWGVVADEPNKLVFSENPGNPAYDPSGETPTTAREQWYYEWLSVSYWYVPAPSNGSPIVSIVPFQDSLTVFTQDGKWVLSGYDRGSLFLRESSGNKGALSMRGVIRDDNNIFFVGDDGFYMHNGSSDEKISKRIQPLFDACGSPEDITVSVWKNQVRFYMASSGSSVNDIVAIWHKDLEDWMLDTNMYIESAVYYNDADDSHELVEFSSQVQTAYLAEQDYNKLGAPIDFEYHLNYNSMGSPMQRKRIRRFYPILLGVDSSFNLTIGVDRDFENSPRFYDLPLTVNGAKWGQFNWGDGTLFGGDTTFKSKRLSLSGYGRYWQPRIIRKGVNNRVAFVGVQFTYKTKRL